MFNDYLVAHSPAKGYIVTTNGTRLSWFINNVDEIVRTGMTFSDAWALRDKLAFGKEGSTNGH